eukprot:CAMPEP_0181222610 /NCGR_PEP_ID=MMETSP1096-20121128/30059_1 /TAXON_ID=156174 ORGANISM="Chrysochromulina ericina, Strain CCMP281" /NCGR_SAMPLE_ID=MMETSP1096 /ASSEMBLY_ACC=CAM_ASM_000453 /LENGTH=47 /DNA_ID= /DNA_START= /DNA_END= /DNA_ORIENTATION=
MPRSIATLKSMTVPVDEAQARINSAGASCVTAALVRGQHAMRRYQYR